MISRFWQCFAIENTQIIKIYGIPKQNTRLVMATGKEPWQCYTCAKMGHAFLSNSSVALR